jgi:hypothetical protein
MITLPVGVFDDPKNQRQELFTLDLLKSNIIIYGLAMSGKTTFAKNLLMKLHEGYSPKTENIYIIDFSGALLKYRELGLVCACFDNSNEENVKRLFNKLEQILAANTRVLAGMNFLEYQKEDKPPHVTFILENLNGFLSEKRYEPYQEKLQKLCREGLSKGITVILTATDTAGGISHYSSSFGQKVAFEMPAEKYAEIFGKKVNPPMTLPGRGIANIDNEIFEFQGFLPFRSEETEFPAVIASTKEHAPKIASFDGDLNFENFDRFSNCHQSVVQAEKDSGKLFPVTVGLDYYEMKPVTIDVAKTASIGIYGKRQSGKTNLLWLLIEKVIQIRNKMGTRVVLFDDGRKQLQPIVKYLQLKKIEHEIFTQLSELKDYLFKMRYYKTESDDYELKDNPYTIFVMQNKSLYTTKASECMEQYFPEMQAEAYAKWLFIYSDVKTISDIGMRNAYNDSLSMAFLLDNIGEFVADRGSKTVFGSMDPQELKEQFARIEKGDGYFYDIESDELIKLKFIYKTNHLLTPTSS